MITPEQRRTLVETAVAARARAYAPYSGFAVGAALLGESGRIYAGINVENCSYGLTICAERSAACAAVAAGERRWLHLALALAGAGTPCGACRQFLAEFAPQLPITIVDADDPRRTIDVDLGELLPSRFEFSRAAAPAAPPED